MKQAMTEIRMKAWMFWIWALFYVGVGIMAGWFIWGIKAR